MTCSRGVEFDGIGSSRGLRLHGISDLEFNEVHRPFGEVGDGEIFAVDPEKFDSPRGDEQVVEVFHGIVVMVIEGLAVEGRVKPEIVVLIIDVDGAGLVERWFVDASVSSPQRGFVGAFGDDDVVMRRVVGDIDPYAQGVFAEVIVSHDVDLEELCVEDDPAVLDETRFAVLAEENGVSGVGIDLCCSSGQTLLQR